MTTITKHLLPHEYMGFFRRLEELPFEEQVHDVLTALALQHTHLKNLQAASGPKAAQSFKLIESTTAFVAFVHNHKAELDDFGRVDQIHSHVRQELGL